VTDTTVEIIPGPNLPTEFTARIAQPSQPTPSPIPPVGLVEIETAAELIAGPPGPIGPVGPPGPQGSPDTAAQVLAKLVTVDGSGSGLDADLLDGQDGAYYLAWANFTGKPATFPPTLPIAESDVTNLVSDLALKAPLASPGLTGVPTAPTATAGTNTTQIASTAFVAAGLAGKVGPDAPNDGTRYGRQSLAWTADPIQADAPNDGTQYVRKSLAWSPVSVPPGTYIGDTPPASPSNGQLFWESDTGNFYIFYVDPGGAPGQWVQVNQSAAAATATADSYNRVVNGAMAVSQENGNTNSATAASNGGYYGADQWMGWWALSGGTALFASVTGGGVGSPNGSKNYLQMTFPGGSGALGTVFYALITQRVEGLRVADLKFGTASARSVVLRFWVNASTAGTYSVWLGNAVGSATRSYVAQFTVSAATWTQVSIVIPGDTTGTWANDNSLGLTINFCVAAGSNLVGVPGWQAGNFYAGPGQVASLPVNATFAVADVGLYADPNLTGRAPPFVTPDFASEFIACQRYFTTFSYIANATGASTTSNYPCRMRIAPAITGGGAGFATTYVETFAFAASQTTRGVQVLVFNARM